MTTYLLIAGLHGLAQPGGVRQFPELLVHLGEGSPKPLLLRRVQLLLSGRERDMPLISMRAPATATPCADMRSAPGWDPHGVLTKAPMKIESQNTG